MPSSGASFAADVFTVIPVLARTIIVRRGDEITTSRNLELLKQRRWISACFYELWVCSVSYPSVSLFH